MAAVFSVAVHAIVYLNHKKTNVSSEALAENICTNPARVRKVMSMLKQAGLVQTKEGPSGGYLFIKDASKTTLRQIADAVDARFVEMGWRSGNEDMECLIASGMADVMDSIYVGLNHDCLKKLDEITVLDIDRQIFQ